MVDSPVVTNHRPDTPRPPRTARPSPSAAVIVLACVGLCLACQGCASSRLVGGVPGPAWADPAGNGAGGASIVTVMLADGSVVAADPTAAAAAIDFDGGVPPAAGTRFAVVEVP